MNKIQLMRVNLYQPKFFAALLGIILLTTGVTLAWAHGGDPNLIHACVKNANGEVRIVSPSSNCSNKETALHWSPAGSVAPVLGGVFGFRGAVAANDADLCSSFSGNAGDCAEGVFESPMPRAGHLVTLSINPSHNTALSNVTVTVIVNGAPTTLTVEIPAGSTTVQIVDASVAVQAGDLVMVKGPTFAGAPDERVQITGTLLYQVP